MVKYFALVGNEYNRSYINQISNETKTIRGLFKDLYCELHTLAIAIQAFIAINENFTAIADILRDVAGKLLRFRCGN